MTSQVEDLKKNELSSYVYVLRSKFHYLNHRFGVSLIGGNNYDKKTY